MEIREDVILREFTTMKIGGPAQYFCEPTTVSDVQEAIQFANEKNIPICVLGGGSNILVSDNGYEGLVIHIRIVGSEWEVRDENIFCTIGAGESWDNIVADAVARGAWGIENLSHIPGTIGGAVVQNIGAYGCEIKDLVEWIEVYDRATGSVRTLSVGDCAFGYRESIFKHEGKEFVVLRVKLRLRVNGSPNIGYKDLTNYFAENPDILPTLSAIRDAVIHIRSAKFPDLTQYGCAGSFFKNPIVSSVIAERFLAQYPNAPHYDVENGMTKLSAAWIIDNVLHMRGVREGSVGCWSAQALVVVNFDHATCDEVKSFTKKITDASSEKIFITLEPEVIFIDTKNIL